MTGPPLHTNGGLTTNKASTIKSMEISPAKTTTRKYRAYRAKRQNSFKGGNNKRGMTRILPNLLARHFSAATSSNPQKRLVRSSIPTLDDEIRVMTQDAPFIKSTSPDENLCLLDRSEVQVGKLLGQGQFSKVFSVTCIELIGDTDDMLHGASSAESPLSESVMKEEQNKRQGFLEEFCQHRYAVKHLKKDLLKRKGKQTKTEMEQQFQLAAADLVVEALYLSRLSHPHILKVKAMANHGTQAFSNGRFDSYFLILDKLSETLDERIRKWRHLYRQPQEAHLCIKTYYALQMAQALLYLHERRILFRDLKPNNTGFREEDNVLQIFDFGLCRELPPGKENGNDNLYFMTAAGTHRYMAVEVLMGKEYNLKADTYSLAMVFYECLAQEAPFLNFSDDDHKALVCERQHRPHHFFGCVVPHSILKLLGQTWEHDVKKRLTMQETVDKLEDILINTFHQTLQEGPAGVKILQDNKEDEKSTSSSLPTSHTTLASSHHDCGVCAGLKNLTDGKRS